MAADGRLPDKDQIAQFLTDAATLQLDLESEGNPVGIACVDLDWDTLAPAGTPRPDG
jgi:hypothetical protein